MTRAKYLQITTQFLQLSAREGLLLTVGEIADLLEMELDRRQLRRKEA